MPISRRAFIGTTAAASATVPLRRARAQRPKITIGILNDMSGTYADDSGPTAVIIARQAVADALAANGGDLGFDVEVIGGDHQNKPDIGATIARQWIDRQGVDVIADVPTSSVALAVNTICREKDRVFLASGPGTTDLTGKQCSPNTVQWTYDVYMLAKSTGGAIVKSGGDTWFFVTADYVFGLQLDREATRVVDGAGGKVLGHRNYPFPQTTDFSSFLVQAQSSGAKVLGLAMAGGDTVSCIKQAVEFGLPKTMRIAALLTSIGGVHSMGLETAQGLLFTESFYWDLNDRTRAVTKRLRPQLTRPSQLLNMVNMGNYGSVTHYLKAVKAIGVAAAKASGAAAVAAMKSIPADDDAFGPGRVREDGRGMHPAYLLEAKKPGESHGDWDLLKVVGTTPADEAFRPLGEGGCPLVKA